MSSKGLIVFSSTKGDLSAKGDLDYRQGIRRLSHGVCGYSYAQRSESEFSRIIETFGRAQT